MYATTCRRLAIFLIAGLACTGRAVTLVERGQAGCVIVVPPGTMAWEGDDKPLSRWQLHSEEPERRRRLLRDSINDLALYLGRMSGTTIAITEGLPAGEKRIPVYVGAAARRVFGPVGISKAGLYGFRIVADKRGVGLYGESEFGTSYAIYELLHRLGCRWFMPSELGACIPRVDRLSMPDIDERLAPATEGRRMEGRTGDADFQRRNRMNGTMIAAQHALEGYITPEQLEANPEWRLHDAEGQPMPGNRFRWTRPDVADAVADAAIARLDKTYTPSISLSPGDYVRPTEDPEERKHDPAPRVWEPAAGRWSTTDRLMMLANRVARRVGGKYPDVLFGVLAYVNYNLPPAREAVHPNVIPMLAPIDFNRHHPMTWTNHPNETWLLDMVQGWGAKTPRLAYYAYGMNLAELSAPCPFITKWGADIPIILSNNCAFWAPETMGGWESMMPGFYLSIRMTFHPGEQPEAILQDLWTRFYGAAADPMSRYWHTIDRAWVETREYSGCGYGYLRMFTPEVLAEARAAVDEALGLAATIPEFRRVQMVDESLTLFELFMKMREDFAEGRLRTLGPDLDRWRSSITHLARRYRPQFAFDSGLAKEYVNWFWSRPYEEATRIDREYARHGRPMVNWKWRYNPDAEEVSHPWTAPDYDDAEWPTTHVVRETWSTLGHHNTMSDAASGRSGRMVYRTAQRLGALPAGKRAYLWIGSTDGSVKLYVNGKHVKYVVPAKTRQHEAGDVIDAFSGYCTPAWFDVTEVLVAGDNQFTILAERTNLNELGTGGLMGPVVVAREK